MRVLSTNIFCLFVFSKKDVQILSIIYTLQLTADKRYARAREISFPFFLSLSVEDRRRLRASLRRLSLSCVFSNDDRVFSERFLNSRTVVFYPILSNFASEPTRSREKTKILHSPLIEHGQRRDQSNELDHPVVAPRSVHGVSDAGAPMMQSSSSSLSSCVRNVFFQRGPLLRKVKKAFSKGPKKTKKRSRRFDFFAEKVLAPLEATPTGRFLSNQRFFSFFFLSFFPQRRREKNDKKKTKGRRRRFESNKKRETLLFLSLSLSLSLEE